MDGIEGLNDPAPSGDVQDPAEPNRVGQDVETEENGAGEGTGGEGQDAAPVQTEQVTETTETTRTENRASDVGGEPANRWSGDHDDNES